MSLLPLPPFPLPSSAAGGDAAMPASDVGIRRSAATNQAHFQCGRTNGRAPFQSCRLFRATPLAGLGQLARFANRATVASVGPCRAVCVPDVPRRYAPPPPARPSGPAACSSLSSRGSSPEPAKPAKPAGGTESHKPGGRSAAPAALRRVVPTATAGAESRRAGQSGAERGPASHIVNRGDQARSARPPARHATPHRRN